jgi:hypothetical protein
MGKGALNVPALGSAQSDPAANYRLTLRVVPRDHQLISPFDLSSRRKTGGALSG